MEGMQPKQKTEEELLAEKRLANMEEDREERDRMYVDRRFPKTIKSSKNKKR